MKQLLQTYAFVRKPPRDSILVTY